MDATVSKQGVILRVLAFAFLEIIGVVIFGPLLSPFGYLISAAMGTFVAAALANALALRIWERGTLADIGLHWNSASRRNLFVGIGGGVAAAAVVLAGPIVLRLADLKQLPETSPNWGGIFFVSLVLLFGAVGEEMLFRGYGFQVLMRLLGPFATVLPISVLFALAHSANANVSFLGLFNTMIWGILLGYAFVRSGDLWLPIGLHFGWNWTLPLFGVNLSGFTMGMTGYTIEWRMSDWWSGGDYGPEAGLLTTLVVGVLLAILHRAPVEPQTSFLVSTAGAEEA